jgi:hypothetical protein
LKAHHFGEDNMKIEGEKLKIIYPSGKQQFFSLDDVKKLATNLRMNVFLQFYCIQSLYIGFSLESMKQDLDNSPKNKDT